MKKLNEKQKIKIIAGHSGKLPGESLDPWRFRCYCEEEWPVTRDPQGYMVCMNCGKRC